MAIKPPKDFYEDSSPISKFIVTNFPEIKGYKRRDRSVIAAELRVKANTIENALEDENYESITPKGSTGLLQNFLLYNTFSHFTGIVLDDTGDTIKISKLSKSGGEVVDEFPDQFKIPISEAVVKYLQQGDNKIYFIPKQSLEEKLPTPEQILTLHKNYVISKIENKKTLTFNDRDFIFNLSINRFKFYTIDVEGGLSTGGGSGVFQFFTAETYSLPEGLKTQFINEIISKNLEINKNLDLFFSGSPGTQGDVINKVFKELFTKEQTIERSTQKIQYMISNPYATNNEENPSGRGVEIKLPKQNLIDLKSINEGDNLLNYSWTDGKRPFIEIDGDKQYYTISKKPGYYEKDTPPGIITYAIEKQPESLDRNFPTEDLEHFLWDVYWYDESKSTEESGYWGVFPQIYEEEGTSVFLEELKKDQTLNTKDISKYKFKYIAPAQVYNTAAQDVFGELWPGSGYMESVAELIDTTFSTEISQTDIMTAIFDRKYVEFVTFVLNDYSRTNDTNVSISRASEKVYSSNFYRDIFSRIIADKEVARRVGKFNNFVEQIEKDPNLALPPGAEGKEYLTEEDEREANKASADAFLNDNATPPTPATASGDEEKNIEGRQRFFKQCALVLNLDKINSAFEAHLGNGSRRQPADATPFDGRFHMVKHAENQEIILNNLISPVDGRIFFEVPPQVLSALTPRIRLFRVENNTKEKLEETEFIFPQRTDIDRTKDYTRPQPGNLKIPKNFLSPEFDKGEGCGLKEFSFEFNGTNPAESRNDIKATLKLYFQTFGDFIRQRISSNGKKYRFVDLVIQPAEEGAKINGVELLHPNQYEPSFYRIRAEVGYNYPDNLSDFYDDAESLERAIDITNKSFYLCMVDHEFNIDVDGTVEVIINYRAYVETALKSLRYDALTTPELIEDRAKATKAYANALDSDCNDLQLKELKVGLAAKEESIKKRTLQSIIRRLLNDGKIYIGQIDKKDAGTFREKGVFTRKPELLSIGTSPGDETPSSEITTGAAETDAVAFILKNNLPDETKKFNYNDISDTTIQWFYFGDLLYTILDSMFEKGSDKQAIGMEKTKFLLGSFDFHSPLDDKQQRGVSIAAIPVSVDFFMKWFTDNVISQGETRKTFPILTFIRNLANNLLGPSLLENCVNEDIERVLRFSTGQISAYSKGGSDPLRPLSKTQKIISLPDSGNFPMPGAAGGEEDNRINNFYTYLTLTALGSTLNYTGHGDYDKDVRNGRYHIDIGSNKGIVKKVNFSKTDMQYIREARFFQHGFDGLMQLSNVYKASVEMFGNTLFYPGNDLFINPYGFGGPTLGSPTQGAGSSGGRSIANILGLGGYHTIISIKSKISPGDYSTTIEAQQYYTGDGTGNPNLNGKRRLEKLRASEKKKLEDKATEGATGTGDACDQIIVNNLYATSVPAETETLRAGEPPPPPPRIYQNQQVPKVEDKPAKQEEVPEEELIRTEYVTYTEPVPGAGEGELYLTAFQPTTETGNIAGQPILWNYDQMIQLSATDSSGITQYEYSIKGSIIATITYDPSTETSTLNTHEGETYVAYGEAGILTEEDLDDQESGFDVINDPDTVVDEDGPVEDS